MDRVPDHSGQRPHPDGHGVLGEAGFLGEIFAYGLRNPYRFSFDQATGALYCGDVGQNQIEEVDVIRAGQNLGWIR
jgi:glucose/arabinose dehydrogenase